MCLFYYNKLCIITKNISQLRVGPIFDESPLGPYRGDKERLSDNTELPPHGDKIFITTYLHDTGSFVASALSVAHHHAAGALKRERPDNVQSRETETFRLGTKDSRCEGDSLSSRK
jgi:hypothetical protein